MQYTKEQIREFFLTKYKINVETVSSHVQAGKEESSSRLLLLLISVLENTGTEIELNELAEKALEGIRLIEIHCSKPISHKAQVRRSDGTLSVHRADGLHVMGTPRFNLHSLQRIKMVPKLEHSPD